MIRLIILKRNRLFHVLETCEDVRTLEFLFFKAVCAYPLGHFFYELLTKKYRQPRPPVTHNCPLNSWKTIRLQIPRRKYQISYLNYWHLEQPFNHNKMRKSQNVILVQYLWIPTRNVTCWQMNCVAEVKIGNLKKSNVDSFPLLFFLPPKSCVIFQPLTLNFIWLWGLPNSHQGSSL